MRTSPPRSVPQKVLYDFNLINRGLLRWLGGSITNLFLHGITLVGTNHVQGLLVASNSPINEVLVIEPGGQLDLAGTGTAAPADWHVLNLGTVRWLSGGVSFSSRALGSRFTNANLFEIHGDSSWS